MNGAIYPDHVRQLRLVGEWYKPRRRFFTEATPMDYAGQRVLGVSGQGKRMCTVGSRLGRDYLIHLFNLGADSGKVAPQFDLASWPPIDKAYLEPEHRELKVERTDKEARLFIPAKDVDLVDTILRIEVGKK